MKTATLKNSALDADGVAHRPQELIAGAEQRADLLVTIEREVRFGHAV